MKKDVSSILEILIKSINDLTDEEYVKLLEGKGKLIFFGKETKIKVQKNLYTNQIKANLELINNREDAYNYLKDIKKDDLLDLAKENNIYALRSDKKDIIIEKVIESFIGVKLRNKAMKEVDLSYKISQK